MWETALLVMTLQTMDMGPNGFSCDFPAVDADQQGITLTLNDRPSLKDQPGLFRVEVKMDGHETLLATAQPITTTAERDALVLAHTKAKSVLTVGFREDGKAALSLRESATGEAETWIGSCRGFEGPLNRWLAS